MTKHLLIVDDDASVRDSLRSLLQNLSYEVEVAADGEQARAQVLQRKPDLIVVDLNMPNRDGWDVLEDASALDPLMPVIVITGMADQLATFDIQGASAVMLKPVDTEPLLHCIERLLAQAPEKRARDLSAGSDSSTPVPLNEVPAFFRKFDRTHTGTQPAETIRGPGALPEK